MVDDSNFQQIKNLIDAAQNIIIVYPRQASFDQKAVAASLYLVLSNAQKVVRLLTPEPSAEAKDTLAGLQEVQTELGHQNLSLSFAYTPEQVDKVSYHIGEQTGKFYLTIKPKAGFAPLDAQNVEFSYTGASADLIITVGVNNLENLEQLYFGYEEMYRDVTLISINNFTTNFGAVQLDAGGASSISEVTALLIPQIGLSFDSDSATNLLQGIESATNNLTSLSASADTFEVVAILLRAGARRVFKSSQNNGGAEAPQSLFSETPSEAPAENSTLLEGEIIEEFPPTLDSEPRSTNTNGRASLEKTSKEKIKKSSKKASSEPPQGFTPDRRI